MTDDTAPSVAAAVAVVDLGLRACEAYHRPDLGARLAAAKRTLANPGIHTVVAGEFKQGKSTLVNALLGAAVCPVDDDVATAVPTYVRYGQELGADLLFDGDPPRREPIAVDDVRRFAVENGTEEAAKPAGVEIRLPRQMLASGLVVVDTPGVGGLGSGHAAASLAAISMADAVVFVTDASAELTRTEVEFLRHAKELCDTVACVLTKTDFYPAWRTIRQLDEAHLRAAGISAPLMAVSSSLRSRAVRVKDTALNAESGFPELVKFVSDRVAGGASARLAAESAAEVVAICQHLEAGFAAERAALADPAAAQRVIGELTATKERVETLRTAAARWNQTLADGIADLNADIDHDLRARIRRVIAEAEEEIEEGDPADAWPEMEAWLEARMSHELVVNYALLRGRADELSVQVADHFRAASGDVFDQIGVYNPTSLLSNAQVDYHISLEKMGVGKQAMVALKSSYGGMIMFTMLGSLAGVALGPISLGIGLLMGRKGLADEKKRQLAQRRSQAKNAIRRYCDEVSFVAGKDLRDTLRRIQRQLRDHYSGLAEELNRSNAEALRAATDAAKRTEAEREKRLKDLDAELGRLGQLRQRALAVAG